MISFVSSRVYPCIACDAGTYDPGFGVACGACGWHPSKPRGAESGRVLAHEFWRQARVIHPHHWGPNARAWWKLRKSLAMRRMFGDVAARMVVAAGSDGKRLVAEVCAAIVK